MKKTGAVMMNRECMRRGMCMCCCTMSCFDALKLNKERIKSE